MTEVEARNRLQTMVAWMENPALSGAELDLLVELAKRADATELSIDDVDWTPTFDLNAAAAEGWRWKAGKAVSKSQHVFGPNGEVALSRLYSHCLEMAGHYARRVTGSMPS